MAKILVVDDEASIRRLLQSILKAMGHESVAAASASEAMQLFIRERPEIVITDVVMPETSGVDLLREIKRRSRTTPVVIISGKPTVEAAVECLKTGASDYILKPVDMKHLAEVIEKCLKEVESVKSDHDTSISTVAMKVLSGYTVRRILGVGTSSIVYLADRDTEAGIDVVALKILKSDYLDDSAMSAIMSSRFSREARVISQIRHPNIVRVFAFNVDASTKIPYMALEYVEGRTLKEALFDLFEVELVTRARIIRQVAAGLAAIHTMGLCHRDIKPQNILVTGDWRVKLTDFGIVRTPDSDLTLPNQVFGTPVYMAPEAYASNDIDGRADLFSLGVVAYELFTTKKPFTGDSYAEIADCVKYSNPFDPRHFDPNFPDAPRSILARLLRKDPDARYQNATDVVADIDAWLEGVPLPGDVPPPPRVGVQVRRTPDRDWA